MSLAARQRSSSGQGGVLSVSDADNLYDLGTAQVNETSMSRLFMVICVLLGVGLVFFGTGVTFLLQMTRVSNRERVGANSGLIATSLAVPVAILIGIMQFSSRSSAYKFEVAKLCGVLWWLVACLVFLILAATGDYPVKFDPQTATCRAVSTNASYTMYSGMLPAPNGCRDVHADIFLSNSSSPLCTLKAQKGSEEYPFLVRCHAPAKRALATLTFDDVSCVYDEDESSVGFEYLPLNLRLSCGDGVARVQGRGDLNAFDFASVFPFLYYLMASWSVVAIGMMLSSIAHFKRDDIV